MNGPFTFDMESEDLDAAPLFYVQRPDGRKDWPEIDRQQCFIRALRLSGSKALVYANANAGKRARHVARKEGILSGVFDVTVVGEPPLTAWIEFKGYDKSGRAGTLSDNQIRFGNRLVGLGHPCACFFDPYAALQWLRDQGFPVGGLRHAA